MQGPAAKRQERPLAPLKPITAKNVATLNMAAQPASARQALRGSASRTSSRCSAPPGESRNTGHRVASLAANGPARRRERAESVDSRASSRCSVPPSPGHAHAGRCGPTLGTRGPAHRRERADSVDSRSSSRCSVPPSPGRHVGQHGAVLDISVPAHRRERADSVDSRASSRCSVPPSPSRHASRNYSAFASDEAANRRERADSVDSRSSSRCSVPSSPGRAASLGRSRETWLSAIGPRAGFGKERPESVEQPPGQAASMQSPATEQPVPDIQDLKAQIEEERRQYIQQRLLKNREPLQLRTAVAQASPSTGNDSQEQVLDYDATVQARPKPLVYDAVPSMDELRLQVQREREAFIGRQLQVSNPSMGRVDADSCDAKGLLQEAVACVAALN